VVAADHVEEEVDSGGVARGGQDVAVVHEEHVGVEVDAGEEPAEGGAVHPVCGRRPTVEQTRGCQHERTGADGDDAGMLARPSQQVGELDGHGSVGHRGRSVDPGDHDGLGLLEDRGVVLGEQ
jgi:hypothetical protein